MREPGITMKQARITATPLTIAEPEPSGKPLLDANGRVAATASPQPSTWSRVCGFVSRSVILLLVALISAYQACIRPLLIGHCPFWPSCSDYAASALARHGMRRGVWLSIKRLARCRPFSRGGYDPVP